MYLKSKTNRNWIWVGLSVWWILYQIDRCCNQWIEYTIDHLNNDKKMKTVKSRPRCFSRIQILLRTRWIMHTHTHFLKFYPITCKQWYAFLDFYAFLQPLTTCNGKSPSTYQNYWIQKNLSNLDYIKQRKLIFSIKTHRYNNFENTTTAVTLQWVHWPHKIKHMGNSHFSSHNF